jgi:hypothetical protein
MSGASAEVNASMNNEYPCAEIMRGIQTLTNETVKWRRSRGVYKSAAITDDPFRSIVHLPVRAVPRDPMYVFALHLTLHVKQRRTASKQFETVYSGASSAGFAVVHKGKSHKSNVSLDTQCFRKQ